MARELGFHNGRHENLEHVTRDTFSWKEFILKEELVRYEGRRLLQNVHAAK